MLNKYVFFNTQTGLPSYIATPTYNDLYKNGHIYGECVAINVTEIDDNSVILSTYHWTGSEVSTHEPKSDSHFIWDEINFRWKEPDNYLQIIKDQTVESTNNLAGKKIIFIYPQHKQTNMVTRAVELQSLNLTDSVEWQSIQAAWDWIKSVVEASNQANSQIRLSTTVAEIRVIEQTFAITIENL